MYPDSFVIRPADAGAVARLRAGIASLFSSAPPAVPVCAVCGSADLHRHQYGRSRIEIAPPHPETVRGWSSDDVPVSGTEFVPALPVPRSIGRVLPPDGAPEPDLCYELRGSAEVMGALARVIIEAGVAEVEMVREPGARPMVISAWRASRKALVQIWKALVVCRTDGLLKVLSPGAPDGLCGAFIRDSRAQWLVEAALGASHQMALHSLVR